MPDLDLNELERLVGAMTPIVLRNDHIIVHKDHPNAAGIVALRNAAPALIAAARRCAELEMLGEALAVRRFSAEIESAL